MAHIADQEGGTREPPSTRPDYVGMTVDERYQVLRLLGSGGMGTVVLARHTALKRLVAIKFVEQQQVSGSGAAERLFREAQAAASIKHPNIIDVLDVGVTSWGNPYLVMEYLQGENLSAFTEREGHLSVAQACVVVSAVLDGLSAAHELGIVHRDLKPQNVVLSRKRTELVIKLIDFGIAKVNEPSLSPLTRSGELVGTPSFMSPEQAKGEDVDARSDIFCVGVLFHRLLTGNNPFAGTNYHSLLHRIATGEPELGANLSADTRAFIERCLAKNPSSRFQSAQEALTYLAGLTDGPGRHEARLGLLAKLRPVDSQMDLGVDWGGASQERPSLPRTSRVDLAPPALAGVDVELEQTLAASTSSSDQLQVHVSSPTRRQSLLPLGLVLVVAAAFCGGWWLAFRGAAAPASPTVSSTSSDAHVSTTGNGLGSANLVQSQAAPSVDQTSTLQISSSFEPHTIKLDGPAHKTHASPHSSVVPSASAPVAPNMLGKSGKNSFFSEDFE
jgi:serine/threonine protein kinase